MLVDTEQSEPTLLVVVVKMVGDWCVVVMAVVKGRS